MEGFIKIHRQLLESSVFASEKRLKIWIWLLCKANYKDRFVPIKINGEQVIQIKRGQLLFGRFKAENEIGIDGSTIYKTLRYLESENMINIQSNSHYTIITINKYDIYQSLESDEVTAKEQQSNNKGTTKEQQSNTPKKDNKDNKYIFDIFRKQYPGTKRGNETEFKDFCKHKDWELCLELLLPALNNEIKIKDTKKNNKEFVPEWKHLKTWINQRCWEQNQNEEKIQKDIKHESVGYIENPNWKEPQRRIW